MPPAERMLLGYIADCRTSPPTAAQCLGTGKVLPDTPSGVTELATRLCEAGYLVATGNPATYAITSAGRAALALERRKR